VAAAIELGHDCFHLPVAVLVEHVAGVAVFQKLSVEVFAGWPRFGVWANSPGGLLWCWLVISQLNTLGF
jgi:hypothetical protein